MKKTLSIAFSLFSLLLFSQNDIKKIGGYSKHEKADSIKVVDNKLIGYSNTIFAEIKGKTFDLEERGVAVNIALTNLSSKITTFHETNDSGFFDINIEKGTYSISFSKAPYGKFEIEKIDLNECQIQEININLGSRINIVEYTIIGAQEITLPTKKKKKK